MRPSLTMLLPVVALAAIAPAASADSFVDTTPGTMAFAVPVGVSSLSVSATAGAGGDLTNGSGTTLVAGGRGALVTGTVAVFAGEQLQLTVATNGGNANAITGTNGGGGAPDGGVGGYSAGGGGGATRVLACQGVICPVAVIAAGGGGAGANGSVSSPFATLAGGPGGAAGARGTDGASYVVSGGSGGQPGTAGAGGTGGSGSEASGNGSGSTGGAGGNHTGSFNLHEGGGAGGGGVFGGGGGGSGAFGTDALFTQAYYAGGGGGGGGSSLAPPGGTLQAAATGATPGIVLTWVPPAGPGSGPGGVVESGGGGVAAVGRVTLSPSAFPAAPSGPSALAAKRRYGTKVGYTLNEAVSVSFTVVRPQLGRKAKGGRCVKPTKANRKARKCTRLAALRGSFTRAGATGANSFRFTGRLAGRKLKPGKYQLVATPTAGAETGRAASASFQIIN